MPECWRCLRVQSSAEVRRTAKGHVCKDRMRCATLVRERREREREARRAPASAQLRLVEEELIR
jgi:hypothetical protein